MNIMAIVRRIQRVVKRALHRDFVAFEGVVLPPESLRFCGTAFRDNDTFLRSSEAECKRLKDEMGLSSTSSVLEIGCGPARLPIGILKDFGPIQRYYGVDISKGAIRWCNAHIKRKHPEYEFLHLDLKHDRYNPNGIDFTQGFQLPLEPASFDIIYLHSVFANMLADDIRAYAREFARLLRPGGKIFLTAFVEDGVPDMTVNPDDYILVPQGTLHFVRYERAYFFRMFEESGLKIDRYLQSEDLGGQSAVHLSLAD